MLVAYLMAGLLGGPVAAAAELELRRLTKPDPVPVSEVQGKGLNKPDETVKNPAKPDEKADWPEAGTTTTEVPSEGEEGKTAKAGSLPVKLAPAKSAKGAKQGASRARRLQVQTLDRWSAKAAGIDGVLIAVQGHGPEKGKKAKKGKARVGLEVDYSDFAGMYGGDWASRLTLREVPECAVTTPGKKGCAPGKAVDTTNDRERGILSAEVDTEIVEDSVPEAGDPVQRSTFPMQAAPKSSVSSGTTLFAVSAAPSGGTGDFTATPLSPSGKWEAGGSSGGFSWAYDVDTPSVPGGLEPSLDLAYSSQSVDGRTAATNNQANWVGDGWSLSPGFIERRYIACEDDKKDGNNPSHKVGDQCWKKENATLSLGGSSSELVKDDASGEWRKKADDGTKIAQLTSSKRGNGDNNGEYWRVTTPDGTRYYFGFNRLPGWAEGKGETNSTFTVPVFGNHSGEPCHASSFKDSWCQQGWRWNLDYVVDPHSNAMAYYWAKESNHYQRNIDASFKGTPTSYTRGGYLKRIEYGLRSNRMYADKAAAKVDFTVSERCLKTSSFDCAADKFTEANAKKWPDVPFDQYCKSGDDCEGNSSPSYFTRKRLTGIATSVLDDGTYHKTDSWALKHQFPSTGDGTDPPLWLASITRTGHTADTPVTLPAVTFKGQQLPNRVEGAVDPVPAYNRYRVYGIETETGGTVGVTYSAPECKAGSLPTPSSNTKRCYPVIWSPPDAPDAEYEPYEDWFHSYVVTQILESDNTAGAPVVRVDYSYLGGLAWAKGDDEFTKAKHRTYGDRRGYERVQTRTGDPAEGKQGLSEARYFRGIAGAKVADGEGNEITDHEAFAGMTRESATYNGVGGALISATSQTPWRSSATASHSRAADNLPTVHAYRTGTKKDQTRTTVTGGTLRRTETTRTFDSYGMLASASEAGDTAKSGDERCTTTSYARNTAKNFLSLVAESTTVAKACGTTPNLPADLVGTERFYYDGSSTMGAAPTKGDETRRDEHNGAGTGYVTVNTASYDAYGRQTESTGASGATTTVAYTPATGQAATKTVSTNALGHTSTEYTDPRRGVTTATVDANNNRTDMTYDALGRVTQAWDSGRSKAANPKLPSAKFSYKLSRTEPNVVTTKTLNHLGEYATSYTFLDGLLRERQSQSPAVAAPGGRVVTETRYDTRGLVWKSYGAYYADGKPSATLVAGDDTKVPAGVENVYDGAGRTTATISLKFGDETKRTTTQHSGDRTTVIPPKGGTATTTITDALGRKTEQRSYTDVARTKFQATTYAYDKHGSLARMTDPAGTSWTWTYDARGRQIKADDPDKGITTTTYDAADRPVKTTDARGTTLTTSYDTLGRKKDLKHGNTQLAAWSYDSVAKGLAASDTRYVDGKAYTTKINGYNDRGQPTSSTTILPTNEGALAGDYTWSFGYNQYTGAQTWTMHPAIGNVPSERVTTNFNDQDLPSRTTAGRVPLVGNVDYDVFARPVRTEYGAFGQKVYRTTNYDEHTGDLTRNTIDGDNALRIEDTRYTYDAAGNTTRISSTSGQDQAAVTDTQCFDMDALRRMTEAWTTKSATDDCKTAPSTTTVGGPDSYWHSYTYDVAGNRTKETQHATGGLSTTATRTYTTGKAGDTNPHALRSVTTTGGPDDDATETFTYDETGNTTARTGGARDQKMAWDAEGNLATLTEDGKKTEYLYDSDGNRMLARNADGTTTAYLPGGNELKTTASGAKTATRYYTHGGETVAIRNSDGFTFLFGDHQGTGMIAVAMGAVQTVTRRKQLPFGGPRSATGANWPGDRGFVGGTTDPTGLTHLGAREYDPQLGRFISVDPFLITGDARQHNPYQYGNSNPTTFSDPTGEMIYDEISGQGYGNSKILKNGLRLKGYTDSNNKPTKKYYKRQKEMQKSYNTYWNTCGVDPECNGTNAANRKAAQIRAAEQAERDRKAAEAQRKKNEKNDGFWKSAWNATGGKVVSGASSAASAVGDWTSDNWDGIKTGLTIATFGACVVVSAGACIAVGAGVATAKFLGDGLKTDNWDYRAYGKDLAWTAVGGGSAAAFGRAFGGAKTWREAYGSNALSRYTSISKVRSATSTGHAVMRSTTRIDRGATYGNMSINAGFNVGFCGAGDTSIGAYAGAC
ncbi:RHS repeat domain-containing protein [Streptomyces apocyni]|uniref:RHS repeat domain-containing protein n=1 Tax=Streptomyces apocyni TaxID=2654677 RepID=UPI001E4354C8|nr:RHS repeat-associated core domain-containing protein [Streptomyces apocyni]